MTSKWQIYDKLNILMASVYGRKCLLTLKQTKVLAIGRSLYFYPRLETPASKWSGSKSPWRLRALFLFEGHAVGPGTITAPWHCYSVIGTFQRRAEQNFTALDSPWGPYLMVQTRGCPSIVASRLAQRISPGRQDITRRPLLQRQISLQCVGHLTFGS